MHEESIVQLSCFMENKPGRLLDICRTLGDAGINIRGFSVADMAEYGIFRVIVTDPPAAKKVLTAHGFTVNESDVLCLDVPDEPGGLAHMLQIFSDNGISVEYMYVTAYTKIVFSFEDLDRVIPVIKKNDIHLLTQDDIGQL